MLLFLRIVTAVLLTLTASAGDIVEGETGRAIDEAILRQQLGQFWGAVGVVKDGKVVLAKGYGLANQGLTANSAKTLFDIGSVTKQFTAAAILRLEMDGKLSIDDRAAMWIDDVPRENHGITILHLLTHTSGISQRDVKPALKDDGNLVATAALTLRAGHKPGEMWEYSNAGYVALAAIIERAAGRSYEEYLREAIFIPSGMTTTRVMGDGMPHAAMVADRVSDMGRKAGTAAEWPYAFTWGYRGAGGVVSNVEDLLAWHATLRTDKVLNAGAREKFFRVVNNGYALGWFRVTSPRGGVVSHSGGVLGFVTFFTRWLEEDAAVVVLTNSRGAPQEMDRLIRRTLFPPEYPDFTAELHTGGLTLGEFGQAVLQEQFAITGEPVGGLVVVRIARTGDGVPLATLRFSRSEAARALAMLERAMAANRNRADASESECGVYTRPYAIPADGVIRLGGDGVTCGITGSMRQTGPGGRSVDERITLSVQDEQHSFMPLLVRLTNLKADELRRALKVE